MIAALSFGAGCAAPSDQEAGTQTPIDTHTTTQTQMRPDCEETTLVSIPIVIIDSETFNLSVSSVSDDNRVVVTLENTSRQTALTGNRGKFDLQTAVDDSWESVVQRPEDQYWTDEAIQHPPGEGFEWQLTLGPGVTLNDDTRPSYVACEPLEPGEYRFVYWGLIGETDDDRERAVAAQFRIKGE